MMKIITCGILCHLLWLKLFSCQISEKIPSIVPYPNFNPEADAKALRSALSGVGLGSFKVGTNIDKVTDIITKRANFQRQQIIKAYNLIYKRNLVKDVKTDTRNKAEDFLVALLTPAALYDAHLIHKAIKWLGTDFETLLEILVTRNPMQLQAMQQAYQAKYKKSMVRAINGDVHGKVEKLFDALLSPKRDSSNNVDRQSAVNAAKKLASGGGLLSGGNSDAYISIFGNNNYNQLKLIIDQFQIITGKTIEEDIKKHTVGKFQRALLKLVESVRSTPQYFAEKLHKAMAGFGTDDDAIIRILTTRSEVDLDSIKTAYFYKYKKPLEKAIRGDVSGRFQKLILAVLRGNKQPYMGN